MHWQLSDQVRGKQVRLSWTEGPTKGTAQDHFFHGDGTVEWRSAEAGPSKEPKERSEVAQTTAHAPDHPPYAAVRITDDVCLVSYRSRSGFTLTVDLNFSDHSAVGIASNEKTWVPVKGTFDIVA